MKVFVSCASIFNNKIMQLVFLNSLFVVWLLLITCILSDTRHRPTLHYMASLACSVIFMFRLLANLLINALVEYGANVIFKQVSHLIRLLHFCNWSVLL